MPGIIRCPESTAIQAGNPDHRGPRRGTRRFCLQRGSRGSGSGSEWSTLAQRCRRRPRLAFPLHGWSRGCDGCGRMPVGGSVSLRRQATCGDGGPAAIAARMLAASPAGMPAVLALPRDHGGRRLACGDGSPRGRLMTEAWSCGVPGQFAGRGGCRWRAEVPGHLGRALPGRRRGTLDSVRIRDDPAVWGSRARAPGRAVFWILAGRYRLCLTTSC